MLKINDIAVTGYCSKDGELNSLSSGTMVCKFSISVDQSFKDKAGTWQNKAFFLDCEAWGKSADFAAIKAVKGSYLYVTGSLKMDEWEKDGQKQRKMKVLVATVQVVTPPKDHDQPKQPSRDLPQGLTSDAFDRSSDIPF